MLKLLKQILSYNRNKNLFDSISEGAWKLPSYLFLVFCRFHVNNDDIISLSSCSTRANVYDLFISIYSHGSESGPDDRLVHIGYFKT